MFSERDRQVPILQATNNSWNRVRGVPGDVGRPPYRFRFLRPR